MKLYAILGLLFFLFVCYWFIAHSFVIVRLTSVLGLFAAPVVVFAAIFYIRRHL